MNMSNRRLPIHDRLIELAEPQRCRLLAALELHELAVGELSTALELPQSTVSRHLRILASQGWIISRAEGTNRWYRSNPDLTQAMSALWTLVGEAHRDTPEAIQDAARVQTVVSARRSLSKSFFSSAATQWERLRRDLFGIRADLMASFALLDHALVVGDLGCGTGLLSSAIAPHVARVHAIDESDEMLSAAREKLTGFDNVVISHGSLEDLPLADRSLDVAVIMLVLHHVSSPLRALREAHRVLRPAGRLLICDMQPHTNEEYRDTMGHSWPGFSPAAIGGWLTEAGFASVRFTPLPADPDAAGPALFTCTSVAMPAPVLTLA